jgi:hypothetical protein
VAGHKREMKGKNKKKQEKNIRNPDKNKKK